MAIKEFKGKYFFLSNFYTSPVPLGGIIFPTGEHAFQAAKCINSDDVEKIAKANTPSAAKALGRRVHMRPDWEDVKYGVMLEVVRAKFYADYGLAKRLLETGDEDLVEGNLWGDRTWGRVNGVGKNWLGEILMQVRSEVAKENWFV